MKILHCADIHLDSALNTNLSLKQAAKRRNEILLSFTKMVEYAKHEQVNIIMISGDLFDTGRISPKTGNVVVECIRSNPDIMFLYISGNHDENGALKEFIRGGVPDNFYQASKTGLLYQFGNMRIYALLESKELDKLKLDANCYNIIMYHGDLDNVKYFSNRNIDYCAMGHVHSYRQGRIDERGIYCYCGCLEARGYDEIGDKGFVLLELDGAKGVKCEFVPFADRHAVSFKIDINEKMNTPEIIFLINKACKDSNVRTCDMVKVVLNGEISECHEIDTEYICQYFQQIYFAFKLEDKTKLKPDILSADRFGTLEKEFIRIVSESLESDEDKEFILKYGIRALAGELRR